MTHGIGLNIKKMDKVTFFDTDLDAIFRIIVVGTLTYISMIVILRVAGKRSLASMNAFDFIITVALGSIYGRILTAKSVSYFESVTAFLLIITLQYIVTFMGMKIPAIRKFTTSQPSLLFYNGEFLYKNLKKERLNKDEILSAVRAQNISSLKNVEAIVFETTGSISVIKKDGIKESLTYGSILRSNSINEN